MKRLFLLSLILILSGCLITGGNRTSNQKLLKEISEPARVERIDVLIFERDDGGRHGIPKELSLHETGDIEAVCSIFNGKKIRTYHYTLPMNHATLKTRVKAEDGTVREDHLFLSGNSIFIGNSCVITISNEEKERLWNILNAERHAVEKRETVPP